MRDVWQAEPCEAGVAGELAAGLAVDSAGGDLLEGAVVAGGGEALLDPAGGAEALLDSAGGAEALLDSAGAEGAALDAGPLGAALVL